MHLEGHAALHFSPMTDATLLRKLIVVLALKLVAITALWWFFVRDEGVSVAAESVAEHIGRSAPETQPNPNMLKNQGKTDGH